MRKTLFFLLMPLLAFADAKEFAALEGEPSSYIEECVSAITGDLIIDQHDIVVQGVEALPLRRRYISREVENPYYKWTPFPHCIARFDSLWQKFCIFEPNMLPINYNLQVTREGKPTGCYVPAKGQFKKGITSHTHLDGRSFNPQKNSLKTTSEGFRIDLPNGTRREYRYWKKLPGGVAIGNIVVGDSDHYYYLEKETLPSGNYLKYSYSFQKENIPLQKIQLLSPSGKEYAHIRVWAEGGIITLNTSDSRKLEYHFDKIEVPKKRAL